MPFEIVEPKIQEVPILVSVPHCGTDIPSSIVNQYDSEMIAHIDDTDWFVDQLYDFVGNMGIKMIKARHSRWVIDLNRNANSEPLYSDGRVITALCPTTDFNNKSIYIKDGPSQEEINRRIGSYYYPYYDRIRLELTRLQKKFKHVLFFDAHSIRQYVPGIRKEKFPDLILGDADQKSADTKLIQATLEVLENTPYTCNHNHPFKGGNLTRTFGQPEKNIHALQLEMAKTVYMSDDELDYEVGRADKVRKDLKNMFSALTETLNDMNR
ncbi:MAG: N-formylglutamate amidohydrolase [Reichenbachiella sp.]|uniref:N-formylglutamate amidohydrolase n=1 Tax=Reichenbachiella sp. TaxID=2184521 RepID=UPI0032647D5F